MKIKLELTPEQFNVICAALGKLPLEVALNTYDAIHIQANQQAEESKKKGE